jgi:hypothetical protein
VAQLLASHPRGGELAQSASARATHAADPTSPPHRQHVPLTPRFTALTAQSESFTHAKSCGRNAGASSAVTDPSL